MSRWCRSLHALMRLHCHGELTMSQDHLGLFDTPPNRRETQLSLALVALIFAAFLLILPFRDVSLGQLNAFIPAADAVMFVAELVTATLLYGQAAIFRSRALRLLATCYVFSAFLLIPHALAFPDAFAPDGLLGGGLSTPSLIANVRRAAFPAAILAYVLLRSADTAARPVGKPQAVSISLQALAAVMLAAGITMLAIIGHEWLPHYYLDEREVSYWNAVTYELVTFNLLAVGALVLFRRRKSVLDTWLLVALSAWLIQSLLIMTLEARFTAGWYYLYFLMLFSDLVVMIALIAESNRLYVKLALSTSAQSRERDARLMSMNAMAAASFQEVGQPLSAMLSSAMASKGWLTRPQPDREKAIESLDDAIAAAQRTFEMMKSVRTRFTHKPGSGKEFCINGLVRETALSMDRELAARKVSLQFDLDEFCRRFLATERRFNACSRT